MSGKQTQEMEFIFNAKLNIQQMNGALQSFQNNLKGLKLPESLFKTTAKDIEKLQGHLKDFEVLTSKTNFNNSEINQVLSLYGKIGNEIKTLGIDLRSLGNIDLQKLMPTDVLQRFQKLDQLLGQIQGQIDFKSSIPDQLKDLGTQADETKSKIKDLENELQQLNNKKNTISSDLASNQTEQRQTQNEISLLEKRQKAFVDSRAKNSETIKKNQLELNKLQAQAEKLQIQIETLKKQIPASRGAIQTAQREGALEKAKVDLKSTEDEIKRIQSEQRSLKAQKEPTSTKEYQDRQKQIENLIQKLNELKQKERELSQGQKTNNKDIDLKTKEYEAQKQALDEINQKIQQLNTSNTDTSKIEEIRKSLADLLGVDISKIPQDLEKLKEITSNLSADQLERVKTVLKSLGIDVSNLSSSYGELESKTERAKKEQEKFNQTNSDISAFKSRIKYLLGLNNAVNLFKRGIRSAFNTVKDLDAAMTETAVVTNMTISDMWKQLPEYTTRANQLGVTTLDAYKAATLYYQQGLNDQQAAELSVETLRMARIAGLEAADATDRMTNALRGFNMELNAMNAQHIDDVYSQLAAMSASNVDEISTAMTKVASLAHNANMDFETTAAFLAQIIETTRESAETAGTALKTVVARFSEVKKLVSEDQLKGQDEEGQVIDVNKVSQALRTAGIDLNKYFVGEVGLDDIFMELASKWDSLTSVQQRYIATQAAGSRQQSRFIAMMQDYARTQELVSAAYNSNGASARQFEKTQDSLQSKLARLKNAWDAFLMGVTNNGVIKVVVSALTLLLNVLNRIADAFGPAISWVIKFGMALGSLAALRKIFVTGNGLTKLLGGLGNTRVGTWLGFGGNKIGEELKTSAAAAGETLAAAGAVVHKEIVSGAVEGAAILSKGGAPVPVPVRKHIPVKLKNPVSGPAVNYGLTGGVGLLTKVGDSKLGTAYAKTGLGKWLGGKFALGKVGGAAAAGAIPAEAGAAVTAAGAGAALLTTLGAVAVAAGLAYIGIKKLYEASPQGRLKAAKKYAETLAKVSENAKKISSEMKEAKAKTEDYEKQISEATTINERRNLIQEQNDYVTSLMEQDERYAKYVTASYEGGELHLTLDSKELATATEEIQDAATRASALTNLANADVQNKQIAVLETKKYKDIDLEKRTYTAFEEVYEEGYYVGTTEVTRTLSDRQYTQQANIQAQINAAEISADASRNVAFKQLTSLYNDQASGEQLNLIADVFTEQVDWDKINNAIKQRESELKYTNIEPEYQRLYGVKLDKDYDKDEAIRAVAYGQILEEQIQSEIPNFIDIAKDTNGQAILQVLAGVYEGNQDEVQEAIQQVLSNNNYAEALSHILGVDVKDLENELTEKYDQLMNQYQQLRDNLSSKLLKAGIGTYAEIAATVQRLGIKQVKQLSKYVDKFTTNYGKQFSRTILNDITQAMDSGEWDGSYLERLANIISDSPILALQELQNWAEKGNEEMQALAENYSSLIKADFSNEDLTRWFFMSDEYDKLSEQIDKFIEENGQINSHNIEELAKDSATLQAILDMDIMSANGLANAINALSKGNIGISDLTDEIIGLYEAFDNTANAVQRAGYYIKNFDPGEDYGDAIDFINNGIEQMQQFLNNGEIGNPQFQRYMGAFFDELPDQDDIAGWQERIDLLRKATSGEGAGFWTDILGFNREGNFIDMNVEDFAQSESKSYIDYIKSLVPEGYNFSDEFYDMMLRNAQNHDAGAFEEIAQVELDKLLNAYENTKPTKADIQAIADAYGLDPEELYQAWYKKHESEPGFNAPEFYEQLEEKRPRSRVTSVEDSDILERKDYQIYHPVQDVYTTTEDPMQAFMQKYGVDETGHFSIDHLYANIGEIIPEVAEGSIKPQEWLQEQIDKYGGEDGKVTIPVTAQVTQWDEETESFHYVDVEFNITGGSVEELEASYYANLEKESQDRLYGDAANQLGSEVQNAVQKGVIDGALGAFASLTVPPIKVPLEFDETSATLTIGGGSWPLGITTAVASRAKGGIVKSAGKGTIEPGLALTGEEAPEIVWNKEKGYAYLAGKNGPEINNLQPGDQVFNGEQTRQILKRSGISSFAKGTINSYSITDKKDFTYWTTGSGKEGASGDSSKSSKDWKNELDWLYDLMEDIAEEEHKQTLIQSEYELAEKDLAKTGRDLYNLTKAELDTLQAQLSAQQFAFEKRLQQMNELQQKVVAEGFEEYLRWNSEDNSLEIDWDKINEITDKDTYDKLSDLVSDMEKVQDQMDEAQEATLDIKKQIQELQTRYLQAFLDFQNRVMEAVVAQYQQNIDSLSELNDTINEANESILDSIQKEIDLQRQIRDNTDTEKEIADIEARLAMLQRDTTGANQQEILELQKQLDEARKDYSDTLIDQAIDRLSQNNDDAQEQREKQIELLEAQLEYWQETGALWEEVAKLIADGFTSQGSIIQGSELWEFLKDADSWNGLSEAQKANWANELIREANQVGAYFYQFSDNGAITAQEIIDSIIGEHGLAGEITAETRIVRAQLNELIAKLGGTPIDSIPGDSGYASGGLATKTGLAMLHGTANEPEYVLNARQTGAFLRLADVLPSIFGSGTGTTNNYGTNVYVELNMSVGEIGSDYDVDRLVARVKDDIYDASSYRNVNAVSFLR